MAKRRERGAGSVFWHEQKKKWTAQLTVADGKKRRKYFPTQKEASRWLVDQTKARNDGLLVDQDKVTVADFLDRYMKDVASHSLRPKTLEAYNSLIKIHIRPDLGDIRLSRLRPDQVQAFYTQKLESGLSRRTVQFMHSILHKTLDQAMKWGLVVRNVTDLVQAPQPKRTARPTWTLEEVQRFLATVKGHRWENIYLLAAGSGCREGEILGLRWQDVGSDGKTIHIRQTVQYLIGKGLVFSEPKTEKSRRPVSLPDFAVQALVTQREMQQTIKQSMGERWREFGLVFTTGLGTPVSPRNLVRHFKESLQLAELPEIRFHDFSRHTHATILLAAGVHPKLVQERFGHSQISITMDTYSHVLPTLQDEVVRKINDLWEPKGNLTG